MCGLDLPFPSLGLTIHQPTIKEIGYIGEKDFFVGMQCLCINKNMFLQDKEVLSNTNNFQIFMTVISQEETRDKKNATIQVLSLLFPGYKVAFTSKSLILNRDTQLVTIDENNFESIQDIFNLIFCTKTGPMDQQNFNPANDKAREIAQKLMKGRERVAAQNGTANASIFSQYISMLTVGLQSMSLQDLINLTMFQLYDLVERYSLYMNWDIDIRSRLAGGKPDKPPDNWMKNIH